MAGSGEPYIGRWTDHSLPSPFGDTLTLRNREANLLIAAASVFVTIVGSRLWGIISFAIHQIRSTDDETDGLFRQQQAILRNGYGPFSTFTQMFELGWAWRRPKNRVPRANNVRKRTLLIAVPSIAYVMLFIAMGILISRIATGDDINIKITGGLCGSLNASLEDDEHILKSTDDAQRAVEYARTCYGTNANVPGCSFLPVQSLDYDITEVECPFGDNICLTTPIGFETKLLNSDTDFGINSVPENRILYRKQATCVPIDITAYTVDEDDGDVVTSYYNLGPAYPSNDTYHHSRNETENNFVIRTAFSFPEFTDLWNPIDALKVPNSGVSVAFLVQNGVIYPSRVEDLWFRATLDNSGTTEYTFMSNDWATAIGCTEKYQWCIDDTNCSDFDSPMALADSSRDAVNPAHRATAYKFMESSIISSFGQSLFTLGGSALNAQRLVTQVGVAVSGLPQDQWKKETELWFQTSLARLQYAIVDYSSNYQETYEADAFIDYTQALANSREGGASEQTVSEYEVYVAQCSEQRVRSGFDHQNISFFSLQLVMGIGLAIIVTSFILEPLLELKRRFWLRRHRHRERARIEDRLLYLHAKAYDLSGYNCWEDMNRQFPITAQGTMLPPISGVTKEHAQHQMLQQQAAVQGGQIYQSKAFDGGYSRTDSVSVSTVSVVPPAYASSPPPSITGQQSQQVYQQVPQHGPPLYNPHGQNYTNNGR